MEVCLSNKFLVNAENEEQAVAYIGIKAVYDKMLTLNKDKTPKESVIAFISSNSLFYEVSGRLDMNKTDKAKLEKGLGELISLGVVDLVNTDGKGNYVLNIAKLHIEKGYNMMAQDEIWSIFNLPCKQKFSLLRFGVGLFSTFNNAEKAGYCSFRKMPDYTGITRVASCQSYFKLLEDNKIIYVRHSTDAKRNEDGTYQNLSNIYGRPSNKEAVNYKYDMNVKAQAHDFTITMDAQAKSKLTRSYNSFKNGKFKGNVEELIQGCLKFNSLSYIESEPEQQKDMSVFDPELVAKVQAEIDKAAQDKKEARQEAKAKAKAKAETPKEEKMEPVPAIEDDDWFDEALETVQPRYGFGTKANNNKKDTENKRKSFGCNMAAKEISPEIAPISTATNGKPKKDWSFLKEQLVAENQRIEELKAKQQWEEENRIPTDEEYYAQEWY